jgi:hypothetical protein
METFYRGRDELDFKRTKDEGTASANVIETNIARVCFQAGPGGLLIDFSEAYLDDRLLGIKLTSEEMEALGFKFARAAP